MERRKFQKNILLSGYTNYKIGGLADFFYEAKTLEDLIDSVELANSFNLPIFILGGGTNLLVNEQGVRGLVLKPNLKFIEKDGENIRVGAGVMMSELLAFALDNNLAGLEWAGGLPGTVGGAIRGNAGAFGGEMKDSVVEVYSLDFSHSDLKVTKRDFSECAFGYRSSIFKEFGNTAIITQATLRLQPVNSAKKIEIAELAEKDIEYRKKNHPLEHPSAGSVFKNVPVETLPDFAIKKVKLIKQEPFPVVPAAHLITLSGLKGVSCGGAMISPKHANFIVNTFNAKHSDVMGLIELAKSEVSNQFGVTLEEEILII